MRTIMTSAGLALALAACGSGTGSSESAAAQEIAPADFTIERVSLPGAGRGDYVFVDDAAGRLYVTHSASVHILDLASLKPLAEVTGLKKAHGVTIAQGKGFATDGDGNAVILFDPADGRTLKTIPAGENPDSILYDEPSKSVFVFNGTTKDISVIDPAREAVVATIPVGDKPEFSRSDGAGKVFVNLEDQHAIAVIDAKARKIVGKYVLDDCEGPAALGLDEVNRRLFSSCGNGEMKVVNADTGQVVAELPVGEDPDGIVYDPQRKRIVVAGRDGRWTIVDQKGPNSYAVNRLLDIDEYAKTATLDPKTGRIFSSTADLVWPAPVPGKKHLPDAKPGSFRLMVVSQN